MGQEQCCLPSGRLLLCIFFLFLLVLVRVTIAVMKHHDQKQIGEERVYVAYASISLFITKGSQDWSSSRAGNWKQELMQRSCRDAAYWLISHGSLSLLSYRTRDYRPRGTTHNARGPPTSITNYKCLSGLPNLLN
jgi:hypothetical protein